MGIPGCVRSTAVELVNTRASNGNVCKKIDVFFENEADTTSDWRVKESRTLAAIATTASNLLF
jgi:hypothetical protein